MDKGAYILILKNDECRIQVGTRGERTFSGGWHAYVGSALGPGGFCRVLRHFRLNCEKNKRPRWHIDSLLLSPCFQVVRALCIHTEERIECHLARHMTGTVIVGFGSSDCSCEGHLFYYSSDPHEEILSLISSLTAEEGSLMPVEVMTIP
ncbi:GIY-YIG nuclease family protein [Methanospirillum hungatei]|uniref:GIY-YIG nuclease family protein n=1 Tax=Methanospirillum hungatei TaxID=2203 RepID=UPI0026EAAAF5|nr:GIY-YIG nuclease family protein [Methanospirillum hungatei]MCA1916943.1 GIY-YIG nuclease family protein [Methanospirillum hungatei]